MTRDEIVEKLRDLMKRSSQAEIDWDAVTERSEILALGIDSLAMLDLIYDVQQEFALEFEAEELLEVKTVGDLASFFEQRMAGRTS